MAKDSSTRLSVSELRRKLQTAPTAAPVSFPDMDLPSTTRKPAEPAPEAGHGIDFELLPTLKTASPNQTPVPLARLTPTDFQRPTGGTSHGSLGAGSSGGGHLDDYEPDPACALFGSSPEENLDLDEMRLENESMKQLLEEMRVLLQEASEQEQRTQAQLLQAQAEIQQLQEQLINKPKTPDELEEWSDELERESFKLQQERRQMDEDRKQMRDDEAALEKQMRDMEVQMARERAMLARQETELKRLNAEIQHELESLQRGDGVLRDRLAVFQRKQAELSGDLPPAPTMSGSYAGFTPSPEAQLPQVSTATPGPKKNDTTGLLRKLFRGDS
jgi:hypothetical protein